MQNTVDRAQDLNTNFLDLELVKVRNLGYKNDMNI